MTMNRGPFGGVACFLVPAVLLLSGCSALSGDTVASAPAAKSGAKAGGTVTVGVTAPGGIDPANAYEPVGKLISSTMCDTLVTLDPVTGQVREGLTRSLVFSPDGTTITLKMRRGLRFNDGTKLGPKDIDFSFQLLNARSTASYVRGLVAPFAAGISASVGGKGKERDSVLADDVVAGKSLKPIAQALNEADVQLFAPKGNGGAVRALAEPAMAPISQTAYRKDPVAFGKNPVCIGPYRLEKPYAAGDPTITLVRAPGYYAKNVGWTGGGKGYLDRIVFRIYATSELAYAGYASGQVDVVAVPPSRASAAARSGSAMVRGNATAVDYLGLPTGLDPYSSTDLRRALSLALDRTALATALGNGTVPAKGFVPSALDVLPGPNGIRTGATQSKDSKGAVFTGCSATTPARADVAGARAALAKARSQPAVVEALAKPLVLYVNGDSDYPAMAQLAARQWKANLGIDVTVTPMRWADYLQKASQGPGFDGAFHFGWATDATAPNTMFNDAQAFLEPPFTSRGTSNWARWSSTDFDFAFTEDAAGKTDPRERGVFFRKLEKQLCDALPMIPVLSSSPLHLVRTAVLGSARTSYLAQSTGQPVLRELYRR